MKIGVLTLPIRTNYGGILQAYALVTVIKSLGNEVFLIQERVKLPFYKAPFVYLKRFLFKFVLNREDAIDVFNERTERCLDMVIGQHTTDFINRNFKCVDPSFIKRNINGIDAIVVGSDQIWRPRYAPSIYTAFLSFAKNWRIKRVAYAPSFGTDEWEYNLWQEYYCKLLVRKFDALSVREQSGVELCNLHFGVAAELVLDPTMLLTTEYYESLIREEELEKSDGDFFVYVLDRNDITVKIEQEICSRLELKAFYSSTDNRNANISERVATKVEAWLKSFYDAEFILTDSFHACVFSILFNKPFVVYGNRKRGLARFHSLLSMFHLTDRLVSVETSNFETAILAPIDWTKVNKILQEQREFSFKFLRESLSKAK